MKLELNEILLFNKLAEADKTKCKKRFNKNKHVAGAMLTDWYIRG